MLVVVGAAVVVANTVPFVRCALSSSASVVCVCVCVVRACACVWCVCVCVCVWCLCLCVWCLREWVGFVSIGLQPLFLLLFFFSAKLFARRLSLEEVSVVLEVYVCI